MKTFIATASSLIIVIGFIGTASAETKPTKTTQIQVAPAIKIGESWRCEQKSQDLSGNCPRPTNLGERLKTRSLLSKNS